LKRALVVGSLLLAVVGLTPGVAPAAAAADHYANHPIRVKPDVTRSPAGLSPEQIKAAYKWRTIGDGTGMTIAVIDAYDDPTAESDLNTFSAAFNPSLPACTTQPESTAK